MLAGKKVKIEKERKDWCKKKSGSFFCLWEKEEEGEFH